MTQIKDSHRLEWEILERIPDYKFEAHLVALAKESEEIHKAFISDAQKDKYFISLKIWKLIVNGVIAITIFMMVIAWLVML
jgi:hypothetical protein